MMTLLIITTSLVGFTIAIALCLLLRKTVELTSPAKTMVIWGSGGHTGEMFKLLEMVGTTKMKPVIFLVAACDEISRQKLSQSSLVHKHRAEIVLIKRSRRVGQSYLSSVWTTLAALLESAFIYLHHRPDLIICNGPGTCIPICLVAKLFPFKRTSVIFVESFCRIQSLSLSGQILYYIADHFLVQWPFLAEKYRRSQYIGLLV